MPPVRAASDSTPELGGRPATGRQAKIEKQARVYELIRAYRVRGHLLADPTRSAARRPSCTPNSTRPPTASPSGTSTASFLTGGLAGRDEMPLREILDTLWDTYTGHVGTEFMHLTAPRRSAG